MCYMLITLRARRSPSDGSWFAEQAHTILPIVEGHPRANWETITPACIESVMTAPSTDLSLSLVLSSRPTARYPWVANRLAEVSKKR
ncbi:BnaC06g12440D [Brassica napus]|uniref:BnaC06g12440D protein n=1 Tax=Brassica napus TaxID=3708 RepID=A0A078II79_BRANA|nr:BnaC06g12440D [Brassica napus]